MAELPVNLREGLVLRDLQDLSYREIADVVGIRPGTVMSRLNRGRKRIRRRLLESSVAAQADDRPGVYVHDRRATQDPVDGLAV